MNLRYALIAILSVLVASCLGCETMDGFLVDIGANPDTPDQVQRVGIALGPATAGIAPIVAGLIAGMLRLWQQKRRAENIIREIDSAPSTPPAVDQVVKLKTKIAVEKITKNGAANP